MPDLFKTKTFEGAESVAAAASSTSTFQSRGGETSNQFGAWNKFKSYKRFNLNLSAGTRIIMTFVLSLVCLYLSSQWALGLLFIGSVFYLCAEVKFSLVWKIYVLLAVFAGIAILFLLLIFQIMPMGGGGGSMGGHGGGGMRQSISIGAPFLRMAVMINMVLAMGMNTSLTGLTNTLSKAYLPGFLKLPLIILVRFVPTFFSDMQQLREAVRIRFRGQGGFWFWVRHPVLWSRILFMPLVVRLIRSGDELAVASELKGLSTKTRFTEERVRITRSDWTALALLVIMAAAAIAVQRIVLHA